MHLIIYLIFLLSIQVNFTDGKAVFCNGQLCEDNCTAIACRLCTPENCGIGGNCRCASASVPGDLSLDQIPQFVLLTMEGPVKRNFFEVSNFSEEVLRNDKIRDSKGCFIKPSYYVQNFYSDYNYVAYISSIGMVGLNSVTGRVDHESTIMHWEYEYVKSKEWIYDYAKASKTYEIVASRAFNRDFCQNYFNILEVADIKIDSSIAENPFFNITYDQERERTQRLWPYTLDYGFHNQKLCKNNTIKDTYCINKTYKGVWEFVQTVLSDKQGNTYDLEWVNEKNYSSAIELLKWNFEDNYKKSRAPFSLNINHEWLAPEGEGEPNKARLDFIKEAFSFMGNHSNVLFATEDRVINWIKNPQRYVDTVNMNEFDCTNNITLKNSYWRESILCDFPTTYGAFYFNNLTCPDYYPNLTNLFCQKDQTCHYKIDDCNCEFCPKCVNNWPGDIYWNYTKEWDEGVCGRIIIANHLDFPTKSAIITMRLFNAYVFKIWGGNFIRIKDLITDKFPCKSETWRIVPYTRDYFIDVTYSYIGFCIHKGIDFQRNFVRLGVEFASSYPQVNRVQDWYVRSCGNGTCEDDELGINNKTLACSVDCLPSEIYSFIFAEILRAGIFLIIIFFIFIQLLF